LFLTSNLNTFLDWNSFVSEFDYSFKISNLQTLKFDARDFVLNTEFKDNNERIFLKDLLLFFKK
jgi:hypothetical protein